MNTMNNICVIIFFFWISEAFAAHPLITDDAGTLGKGNAQLEFIGEYGYDDEEGVRTNSLVAPIAPVLSYGITDNLDIVLGISYLYVRTKQKGTMSDEDGISDTSIELKWRFYAKEGLGLAIKPGISLPTGDNNKGLGNGRPSYGLVLITTKEIDPWAFHLNLGYTHIEYRREEDTAEKRKGIWHASLASEVDIIKDLKAVANTGIERNFDKTSNTHPAFILGGLIYAVTEKVDIDFGIKGGLNKPATDYSFLAGITWRF